MPVRNVNIELITPDQFCYRPSSLRVNPGDQVQWHCQDGPFAVRFQGRTPFEKVDYHSSPSPRPPFSTPGVTVRNGVALGCYHYTVAVARQTDERVIEVSLDGGCPEIIIEM